MLNKALTWVYDNRKYFDPLSDDTDTHIKKMFAELQLALILGKRNQQFLASNTICILDKLIDFSTNIIENPSYYNQILLNLKLFRVSAAPVIYYLTLKSNPILEEIIRNSYKKAYDITPELLPYRLLDVEHMISLTKRYTGVNIREKICKDVFKTILTSNYDILYWGINEEYALTHSIFYATDFGKYKLPQKLKQKISRNIRVLAANKLVVNDFDLLGEYIINMCNLNIFKDFRNKAYDILMHQQNDDGYIIAPFRKNNDKLDENTSNCKLRNRNIVRNNYHTTLVAVMASFCIKKDKQNEK